jgi:hypothetical protein
MSSLASQESMNGANPVLFAIIWKSLVAHLGFDPENVVSSKVKRTLRGAVQGKAPQSLMLAHYDGGDIK